MKKILLVSVLASLLTGCLTRAGDFTVYSTKNIDVAKSLHYIDEDHRVTGRCEKWQILGFYPWGEPTIKDAVDAAEESRKGCVGLTDVVLRAGGWSFIAGQTIYEVEGNPIFERKGVAK